MKANKMSPSIRALLFSIIAVVISCFSASIIAIFISMLIFVILVVLNMIKNVKNSTAKITEKQLDFIIPIIAIAIIGITSAFICMYINIANSIIGGV